MKINLNLNLTMITAIDRNFAIGKDGKLLFDSKLDMSLFKARTMGYPVIMGRKTFESIGLENGLAGRYNIVVSKSLPYKENDNLCIVETLEKALIVAERKNILGPVNKLIPYVNCSTIKFNFRLKKYTDLKPSAFIIGGASLYNEALSKNYLSDGWLTMYNDIADSPDTYINSDLLTESISSYIHTGRFYDDNLAFDTYYLSFDSSFYEKLFD